MSHIERMKDEHRELKDKVNKLSEFIFKNQLFDTLSKEEQVLMIEQHVAMKNYLETLDARLFLAHR